MDIKKVIVIVLMIAALGVLIGVLFGELKEELALLDGENGGELPGRVQNATLACATDSDCVPASCCHPSSCVNRAAAPSCKGVYCTLVCQPGTLDCGQGSCACVRGQCTAVFN